jgi:hypothetical protein
MGGRNYFRISGPHFEARFYFDEDDYFVIRSEYDGALAFRDQHPEDTSVAVLRQPVILGPWSRLRALEERTQEVA